MSAPARPDARTSPAEAIAGFLAACALLVGPIALAYRPVRLAPFAVLFALIAAGIGGRFSRLAAAAVAVAGLSFVAGTIIAVVTNHPVF